MSEQTTARWPAINKEPRAWTAAADDGHLDVWQRHRFSRPYHAAVLPRISELIPTLSAATDAAVAEATADISRFDAQMAALPVTMPAVLLRSESSSSSQIEHLTANARNLAMASLGLGAKQNAELVAANVRAMTEALRIGDAVSPETILAIHRALLSSSDPDVAGHWRAEQVWVGSNALSPHDADFIPPHHERLDETLADLTAFAARDDIPALAHAALVHAQFETIHPFVDGNGRTGRVLLQSVLRRHGLIRTTTVPVSAGLLRDPEQYFDALTAYRAGDPDPIVVQVAEAALLATDNGRQLAQDVVDIRTSWLSQITARSDSAAWRLADALFAQPVVNAEYVTTTLGVSDRAARNAIASLEHQDVLAPTTSQRRHRAWQASSVLAAMDAFARRAGRRA